LNTCMLESHKFLIFGIIGWFNDACAYESIPL
jgi:hypothetical protein